MMTPDSQVPLIRHLHRLLTAPKTSELNLCIAIDGLSPLQRAMFMRYINNDGQVRSIMGCMGVGKSYLLGIIAALELNLGSNVSYRFGTYSFRGRTAAKYTSFEAAAVRALGQERYDVFCGNGRLIFPSPDDRRAGWCLDVDIQDEPWLLHMPAIPQATKRAWLGSLPEDIIVASSPTEGTQRFFKDHEYLESQGLVKPSYFEQPNHVKGYFFCAGLSAELSTNLKPPTESPTDDDIQPDIVVG